MREPIRAIIWDIDGTLVDSEPHHFRALLTVCRGLGLRINDADAASFIGIAFRDTFKTLSRFGEINMTFDAFNAKVQAEYIRHVDRVRIRDGAPELVDRFAGLGLRQACFSNSPRAVIAPNLKLFDDSRLEFAVSREDVANGKPDPEGYLMAARRLGVAPAACAVIEDSPIGTAAAKAAGMLTVAWPQDPNFVYDQADYVTDDPGELDWDAWCHPAARVRSIGADHSVRGADAGGVMVPE